MAAPMSLPAVVHIEGLVHDYGSRRALEGIDLSVSPGEIFGLLGPNGGGKTTLFRILATLMRPTGGRAAILGRDVVRQAREVRAAIGVVFQSPALDRKLTVRENLVAQGRLYGLSGRSLRERVDEMLRRVGLVDRGDDRVEILSGGLRRRAEIAKGVLHRPPLLLLDEPSSGLDPGARHDLWVLLEELRQRDSVTILLTTHFVEEAERCDRLGLLCAGRLVGCGAPAALKGEVGGDVIVIATRVPEALRDDLERRFGPGARVVDGSVRLERPAGHTLVPRIVEAFADRIDAVTIGKPTLLDVFVHKTGRRFQAEGAA